MEFGWFPQLPGSSLSHRFVTPESRFWITWKKSWN
jgi:hypothetical protein